MTEDGRWSGCSRQGFTFPGTLLGWRWMAKSLNGQLDEWWNGVWGARSRRDTAALALDSSLLRRPALMHFRHELTSLLSDWRRKHPPLFAMPGKRQLPLQLDSPVWSATSERRPAEACAERKVELGASLRAASTSRDQSGRTGVCMYCDQHTYVAWEAYSSSAWRGGHGHAT